MHSTSGAIAKQGIAFQKTGAALDVAIRILTALDETAAWVGNLLRRTAEARRRHRDMVETMALLSRLDDHQLRDIGVERGQIVTVVRKVCD